MVFADLDSAGVKIDIETDGDVANRHSPPLFVAYGAFWCTMV